MNKDLNHPILHLKKLSFYLKFHLISLIYRKITRITFAQSALFIVFLFQFSCNQVSNTLELPPTAFMKSEGKQTETYESGMQQWRDMATQSPHLQLIQYGPTDADIPLHLAVLSPAKIFNPDQLKKDGYTIILVNNAIHPGEPDGVDASLLLCRELIQEADLSKRLEKTVIAFIPFYNIGGALNRNSTTRANQQGPESYGFRGNAQNYDLNRDFIKSDTRNAKSFAQLFTKWSPDVFVDTHVSNGADYQYNITCLDTQPDKLGGALGKYLREEFTPALFEYMEEQGEPMTPYVNVWGSIPDSGWVQFMDHPRYTTGYAALHHSIGFMTETHMLKPFDKRVMATKRFLEGILDYAVKHGTTIQEVRKQTIQAGLTAEKWAISWKNNPALWDSMRFKGYEATYPISEVTNQPQLRYNRKEPFEKTIKLFNHFEPEKTVDVPKAYLIPRSWRKVVERLQWNNVAMEMLEKDSTFKVGIYHIGEVKTRRNPYEGHYLHTDVEASKSMGEITMRKGDYVVYTAQPTRRFIIETLEPEATDSYFRWNFFDIILQRKEGFSPYVFEQEAMQLLNSNPDLKAAFEEKKIADPQFAKNAYAQLRYLYEESSHAESAYRRYPIYRIEE